MTDGFPIQSTILRVLPDFCWQTAMQVVTMLEQIDEDVLYDSVKRALHELAKEGKIDAKEGGINPQATEQGLGRPHMRVRMYKAFDRRSA